MRDYRRRLKEKGLKKDGSPIPEVARKVAEATTITLTVKYIPHAKQVDFAQALDAGKRFVLYVGGVRAGKTYAGARESIRSIYKRGRNKKGLGWIISPTYPMSSIVEREFENACDLPGGKSLILKKYVGQRAYLLYPPKGCDKPYRVEIKTAEHPDRLRGSSLDWVWMDEAAMMDHETYKILMGRVLDTSGLMMLTTTPRGMNWLHEEFLKKNASNPNFAVIKAMTTDNPHITFEDVEQLRSQYSQNFARQEINAEFVSLEGLVYQAFDFNRHVIKPVTTIPAGAEIVCGIDAGYKDPFVCLSVMKHKDRFYVIDEYYATMRTMESHAFNIKGGWLHTQTIRRWMDPSAAQESADLHAQSIGTFPAKNDIRAGINAVARMIETDRLFVAQNCLQTLNELSMYRYKDSTSKNAGEVPIDKDNHCMDALRYVIYSEDGYQQNHPFIVQHDNGLIALHGTKTPVNMDEWIAIRQAHPVGYIVGDEGADGGEVNFVD
jgi:PBSX family phage terminase large subunit